MPEIAIPDLTEAQAAEELTRLADEIAAHDLAYHQADAPVVSDAEYDALRRRNAEIEARFPHLVRENSPSMRVGASRSEQFSPVEHGVPMLSLDNAFSSTASRPPCATRAVSWCVARPGATAGWARTSPPTS